MAPDVGKFFDNVADIVVFDEMIVTVHGDRHMGAVPDPVVRYATANTAEAKQYGRRIHLVEPREVMNVAVFDEKASWGKGGGVATGEGDADAAHMVNMAPPDTVIPALKVDAGGGDVANLAAVDEHPLATTADDSA